jgi:MurNAc alpha-1-phosphate uridylyltransferase
MLYSATPETGVLRTSNRVEKLIAMTVENAAPGATPAMLLAAGRGERMRPLTDVTPKPLLKVQGVPLLQLHMQALAAGVPRAVINTGWLGAQIPAYFGDEFVPQPDAGASAKLLLSYSAEPEKAFETAGGISRALPQLGRVFWLAAGDVYAPDFCFAARLPRRLRKAMNWPTCGWCPILHTIRAATLA